MTIPGIPCPKCHKAESTVTDTRRREDGIRRRRKCFRCGARFWTVEVIMPVNRSPAEAEMRDE